MNPTIDTILEGSEQIKWRGVINRKVLAVLHSIGLVIIIAISLYFFSNDTISYTSNGNPAQASGFVVGSIILGLGLLIGAISLWSSLVREYAITTKRIIMKSGIIGTDFKSIYSNEIKNVVVDVGIIGKIFSVGTVRIDLGKTNTYSTGGSKENHPQIKTETMYEDMIYIDTPYDVYKIIQSSITERSESLYSGRADRESNPEDYQKA